jgi:aminoglycoside phosphotransferase (APT) family kinase protein
MVRELVSARLPGYRVTSVVRLGEGLDNVAYEVNGELIARFSKEPDPVRRAAQVAREARLLTAVAGFSPVPVPEPAFTAAEEGCLAYFKIPGRPLLDAPAVERYAHGEAVAKTIGGMLAAIHATPPEYLTGLVGIDDLPLAQWLGEAAGLYPTVVDRVPVGYRPAIEEFLAAAPPDDDHPLVFSHNDLGIEHILTAPGTSAVTGVIDWGDAAIVDPAYDFGLLFRDLGPAALVAALEGYAALDGPGGGHAALAVRAVFYARCSFFEDLGYGQDRYVDKSIAALPWLFAA